MNICCLTISYVDTLNKQNLNPVSLSFVSSLSYNIFYRTLSGVFFGWWGVREFVKNVKTKACVSDMLKNM